MGEKQNVNKKSLIQKGAYVRSWLPETTSVQGAQEATAPFPVCSAFGLPLALLPPPKLIARGADLAGSQISVLGT